jgi:hypothetical protein
LLPIGKACLFSGRAQPPHRKVCAILRRMDLWRTTTTIPLGDCPDRDSSPPNPGWHEDKGSRRLATRKPQIGHAISAALDPRGPPRDELLAAPIPSRPIPAKFRLEPLSRACRSARHRRANATNMPPRRSHKKSRAGCRRCKARKIKVFPVPLVNGRGDASKCSRPSTSSSLPPLVRATPRD